MTAHMSKINYLRQLVSNSGAPAFKEAGWFKLKPGATRFQCNNWRYANPALARGGVGRSLILLGFLFTFQTCIVTAH